MRYIRHIQFPVAPPRIVASTKQIEPLWIKSATGTLYFEDIYSGEFHIRQQKLTLHLSEDKFTTEEWNHILRFRDIVQYRVTRIRRGDKWESLRKERRLLSAFRRKIC